MKPNVTPLFIFSLPRSGSTLLQRILGASEKISTISEPWLLLPTVGSYSEVNMYTEYGQSLFRKAFIDFIDIYPGGIENYRSRLNNFYQAIYDDLSSDHAIYFIDKTPRYHLISDEIIKIFPNAKFIFLWRNPEDIVLSIANTWYKSTWTTYPFEVDLFKGFKRLVKTYLENSQNQNVLSLKYEDLTNKDKSEQEIRRVKDFLSINDISFQKQINLDGSLGDKPISKESRESRRKNIINTLYRKNYILKLINQLDNDTWFSLGYDKTKLIEKLNRRNVILPISISDIISISKRSVRKKIIPKSDSILY